MCSRLMTVFLIIFAALGTGFAQTGMPMNTANLGIVTSTLYVTDLGGRVLAISVTP
jgi:hypothetical protein